MPSSDCACSSRKLRRLPNMMSRSTSRLHRSPKIFNETNRDEVIGHLVAFVDRIVRARAGASA